jgi:hypothetical protein
LSAKVQGVKLGIPLRHTFFPLSSGASVAPETL